MTPKEFRAELVKIMPGYWMDETSGVLRPAIEAYLADSEMTAEQIAAMRAYLRQWINAPEWRGGGVLAGLRISVDVLENRDQIEDWLDRANEIGIDPL